MSMMMMIIIMNMIADAFTWGSAFLGRQTDSGRDRAPSGSKLLRVRGLVLCLGRQRQSLPATGKTERWKKAKYMGGGGGEDGTKWKVQSKRQAEKSKSKMFILLPRLATDT